MVIFGMKIQKKEKYLNVVFVSISFLVIFLLIIWFVIKFFLTDSGMEIVDLNKNEAKCISVKLYFEKLKAIGEISLALIGLLWALVIYKNNKIKIISFGQKSMFIATNFLFFGSFLLYFLGYDFVLGRIFFHSSFDLSAPVVSLWREGQLLFFFFGIIWLILTLLSCIQKDKEGKNETSNNC